MFKNTKTRFGKVTKLLHWGTALLTFPALGVGLWLANTEITLEKIAYFGYHKTAGITLLGLITIRICWHFFTPPPRPVSNEKTWQNTLAFIVHRALYVLMIVMPISGWVASSATGIDTVIFNSWTLPAIAPASEIWERWGFLAHQVAGYTLIALLLLHVGAALFHALLKRDGTLGRITTN